MNNMLHKLHHRTSTSNYGEGISLPPARLNAAKAAEILGFQEHEVPILVKAKLLKPLGKPAPNGTKFFAAVHVLSLFNDADWLNKSTQRIYEHWDEKNSRKSKLVAASTTQTPETSLAA